MKLHLPRFLFSALLATQSCALVHAESTPPYTTTTVNNVVYTLSDDDNDGYYDASATIGAGDALGDIGSTYIAPSVHGDSEVDQTKLQNITISMDVDRTISGILTGGSWLASPIEGSVTINISSGYVSAIYAGNRLHPELTASYRPAAIDSITVNIKDNAKVGYIVGGTVVSDSNGWPENFRENFTTIENDVSINVTNGGTVTDIYGINGDIVKGNIIINTNKASINGKLRGTYGGTVYKDVTIDAKDSEVEELYGVHYGTANNVYITTNESTVTTLRGLWDGDVIGDTSDQGNVIVMVKGGTVDHVIGTLGGSATGDVIVSDEKSQMTSLIGVCGSHIGGNSIVNIDGNITPIVIDGTQYYGYAKAVQRGTVDGNATINMNGGNVGSIVGIESDMFDEAYVDKDLSINFYGGTSGDIVGITSSTEKQARVGEDVNININGGSTNNIIAIRSDFQNEAYVGKNVNINLNGGTSNMVFGVYSGNVGGNTNITMNGGTVEDIIGACSVTLDDGTYRVGKIEGDLAVHLLGGTVNRDVWGVCDGAEAASSTLYIGSADKAYNGTVNEIAFFDNIVIATGSGITTKSGNVLSTSTHHYSVSQANLNKAIVTTSGHVSVEQAITLNLNVPRTLKSGRYMLIDARGGSVDTTNWNEANVTVTGGGAAARRAQNTAGVKVDFHDTEWVQNVLYLYLVTDDTMNMITANWGLFKSSQAFVNTLWSHRNNSSELRADTAADGKGSLFNTPIPASRTLAWGTIYGQSARIGGVGADYSLYGGAIGIEHHRTASRSSIGLAFGYDWGKVSPFQQARIDQETAHLALYGRAGEWAVGKNGNIALDWSATIGESSSETDTAATDWEQKHLQIDARVSYLHRLNPKATASIFAGIQYYAAEDAKVEQVGISSMQNLRTEIGAGITYKATPKTTMWGEVSLYNDAMRHNPYIYLEDRKYNGTNPGRLGGSVSVGAGYQLSEKWSLQGNYSFDAADDSTEHNMNVGATYRF